MTYQPRPPRLCAPVKRAWVAVAVGVVALAACGGDDPSTLERVDAATRSQCPDIRTAENGVGSFDCQLTVTTTDDGSVVLKFSPDGTQAPTAFDAVLAVGKATGCWSESDGAKIRATRPLDGMVESSNGRSWWVYDSDSGLTISCSP